LQRYRPSARFSRTCLTALGIIYLLFDDKWSFVYNVYVGFADGEDNMRRLHLLIWQGRQVLRMRTYEIVKTIIDVIGVIIALLVAIHKLKK